MCSSGKLILLITFFLIPELVAEEKGITASIIQIEQGLNFFVYDYFYLNNA